VVRWLVVFAVLAGVAVAGQQAVRRWTAADTGPDVQLFEVTRRSFPITITEKGELKAVNSVDVKNEVEGRATIIYLIAEGTHVKKGDLLIELASDEIEERVRDLQIKESVSKAAYEAANKEFEILRDENRSKERKAQLALEMAEIALQKYKEGDATELEENAKLELEQAEFELRRAEKYLEDSEELYKEGFITQLERDNDEFTAYKARNELTRAKTALEVLQKYEIPMNLKEKESDVSEARAELERTHKATLASEEKADADAKAKKDELEIVTDKLKKAVEQKEKTKIYAPAEGLVVYMQENRWDEDSRIKSGAQVYERQSLIELPDVSSMKVVLKVHEAQIEHLKQGQPATISVEGFAGRHYPGEVTRIAVLADSQHRWINPNLKEFETEVLIKGDTSDLKPGGTAEARIEITRLENVLAVPVQAVFGKGNKYYVFVDEGGTAAPREVKIGLSSTEYVEIKKGIEEGQQVRLAVTEEMKLELPEVKSDEQRDENGGRPEGNEGPPRRERREAR
jgi:HlyD family secretion protein